MPYKYHLRPGYGSDKLLLEFFEDNFKTPLREDLPDALREINPQVATREDDWLRDEIACLISSDQGAFDYLKDNWGFAFFMADDNQTGLLHLEACLARSRLFEKVEVDFTKYK